MKSNLEDLAWISRIVLWGDEKAFEQIVRKYQQRIRYFFLLQSGDADLSDDLAQETFIRVWTKAGDFKKLATFSTWLYSIANHLWMDHCKKNGIARYGERNSHMGGTETLPATETMEEDISIAMERHEKSCHIRQCIARLPAMERSCITLFYLEEFSIREVSRITGQSETAVKTALSRGRNHLKELLRTRN